MNKKQLSNTSTSMTKPKQSLAMSGGGRGNRALNIGTLYTGVTVDIERRFDEHPSQGKKGNTLE